MKVVSCGLVYECGMVDAYQFSKGAFMRIRHMLAVSFGLKIGIVLLCVSLVCVNRLFGASYFNMSLNLDQQKAAVKASDNVDARNRFGLTGLMAAAIYGESGLAKALVRNGAHLNLKSTKGTYTGVASKVPGQTALHFAANNMRAVVSRDVGYYLIKAYADVRLKNSIGDTPLQLVISTDTIPDRTEMVTRLIKNGADINAQNAQGDTLIHLAANLRAEFWLQDLIKRFGPLINFNLKNKLGLTPHQYALRLGFTDTATRFDKPVPAMPAADEYYKELGVTGLMMAIMKNDQKLIAHMAQNKKALNMQSRDQYGNTALHLAHLFDDVDAVKVLLQNDASTSIKNSRGEIPVDFLPRVGTPKKRIEAATLLLKKNPESILSQNKRGENLIHYLVRFDNRTLLEFLIKNYRALVQKAAVVKNNALQNPRQLASLMRRRNIGKQLRALRTDRRTGREQPKK